MTHDELVNRAVQWLRGRLRSRLVIGEAWTWGECPDAIGWARRWGGSHIVECKVSLTDFYRDRQKCWRQQRGLGLYRWYMTPPGLLRGRRLPALWGLLEVHPKQTRQVIRAKQVPLGWWDYLAEMDLLAKWASIWHVRGIEAEPARRGKDAD